MRFAWWVSNDTHTAFISLRQNFIPDLFNELLDRLGTTNEQSDDQQDFSRLKQDLANKILQQPLLDNFHCDFYRGTIKPHRQSRLMRKEHLINIDNYVCSYDTK
jgi:hypothetical protein